MTENSDVIIGGLNHRKSKKNKRSLTVSKHKKPSFLLLFWKIKWDVSRCDRGDRIGVGGGGVENTYVNFPLSIMLELEYT